MYGNIRQWFPKFSLSAAGFDYSTYELLYSISRKLNPSYSGSAFRIIRDSDSAQQDIGFVGSEVDTAAIATFCSGTTGRIQAVYNQGTAGSDFDVTFYTGTRSIIYQSGTLETVNGKPAMLGQASNGYRTALLAVANSKMDTYKIHSTVLQTQNGATFQTVLGEQGTASGNNRKLLFSDTTTNRFLIDNIVTSGGYNNVHLLLVQSTQNQHRQYSFINAINPFTLFRSRSYWNSVQQAEEPHQLGWGDNVNFHFYIMRNTNWTFLGRFQEMALKITDGSNDETELRALEAEQNAYYGIY